MRPSFSAHDVLCKLNVTMYNLSGSALLMCNNQAPDVDPVMPSCSRLASQAVQYIIAVRAFSSHEAALCTEMAVRLQRTMPMPVPRALRTIFFCLLHPCVFYCSPIDDRERRLARKGPIWRTPMAFDVLRNLPFLRHVPQRAVEVRTRAHVLSSFQSFTQPDQVRLPT